MPTAETTPPIIMGFGGYSQSVFLKNDLRMRCAISCDLSPSAVM